MNQNQKLLYPDFKTDSINKESNSIFWLCPNCSQWTNSNDWICCCSRECLKQWLDSANQSKK